MALQRLRLPQPAPQRVLACGAFLKNSACLIQGDEVLWSPQHGDLSTPDARNALVLVRGKRVDQLPTPGPQLAQVAGAAGIAVMIAVMSATTASALADGADATAAGAAGAHAAFLLAAILSLPVLVGAFFIRKPEERDGEAMPIAH